MRRLRCERRSNWPAVVLVGLVLVSVLYVSSIGPTGHFYSDNYDECPAWENAYSPILWATDRSDALNDGLNGYLHFWGAHWAACQVAMRRLIGKRPEL